MNNPDIDPQTSPLEGDGLGLAAPRWQTNRRRFLSLTGMAVGVSAIGLTAAGCGSAAGPQTGNNGEAKGRPGASGDTLFVGGFQWGPPKTFNPFAPVIDWPCAGGQSQLIHESLLRFNLLDGSLAPGLGTELQQPDDLTMVVPLQEGTKWSDGTDLTADDVVFTFMVGKEASVSFSQVWTYLDSVTATDPRTVTFKLKESPYNPLQVKDSIAKVLIVSKAQYEAIGMDKITTEPVTKPVGSGPYVLDKYDQTQIALKRADAYWGATAFGTPAPLAINHPIVKGNSDFDLKLEAGEVDAAQTFTAQIWKMWEDKKLPVSTWLKEKPYHLPGNLPLLIMNLTVKGLDNPLVRKAIAHAIDYPNIAATAMSDYSVPANASLIVPTGYEEKYYDSGAVEAEGWTFDKDKAISILEDELSCTKGSDGIYSLPDGTKLGGWKLITPTGWTDWNTACEIVAKSAQAVGIGITTEFPQAPTMQEAMQNGNFQLCMFSYSGVSAASPWIRFRDAMDDRGVAEVGKTTFFNYNRFKHPDVPGLLDAAAGATDEAAAKEAYAALDKIYREQIPVVPLMYRPLEFYQFNASNWDNFPTAENPYAPPMWQGAGIQWLFKIKRTGT